MSCSLSISTEALQFKVGFWSSVFCRPWFLNRPFAIVRKSRLNGVLFGSVRVLFNFGYWKGLSVYSRHLND